MVHDFTLVYALNPELDSQDEILRRLVGSDCADAMVGWGRPGHVALAFGYHRAPAQAWAHRAFGSRESICQRRPPQAARRSSPRRQHEPQGQLLG